MLRSLSALLVVLIGTAAASAHGLLIPVERSIPPLAMLNHQVKITIEDQAATTKVEQTFRNHTDRALEATYIFPVPKGASVRRFTMWVNDKEVPGELVEADKARQIYTDIVRRTQDPGLLEYMGNNLLRLRVFPVPAKGDQKLALSFTSVAPRDAALVEYVYPLKTDGKATRTLEKFSLEASIKSQHPIQNVYSPTHAITMTRPNDHEAQVRFEQDQALLDKDFQLFYAVGDSDVGMTLLTQRPITGENGFFMLLLSPRVEASKSKAIPRDTVLVLDTSGSMRGVKMDQAKKALQFCLKNLEPQDRFGLINFATTVNKYKDGLVEAGKEQLEQAGRWVDQLEATGGTAIDDALSSALQMRTTDAGRSFTMVFFTDGCPTIGETDPTKILKNAAAKNSANTRIFTFGVGDDVNATLLDQLAEDTRAVSTYVRPAEDIEVKVSGLYSKISHPVLTNLTITSGNDVRLSEIYPPQLPDLFRGGQVVVLGRYSGKGHAALTLRGMVGMEAKEFVYEANFPDKTTEDKGFVEHLWARRKVGYLLDQIRANGAKKELVDETVALAKKYGIATPYTSYLVVPDAPVPVVRGGMGGGGIGGPPGAGFGGGIGGFGGGVPHILQRGGAVPQPVANFARELRQEAGELGAKRGQLEDDRFRKLPTGADGAAKGDKPAIEAFLKAKDEKAALEKVRDFGLAEQRLEIQTGKTGVDLSIMANGLRAQTRLTPTALRRVAGRNCLEIGGVWIDEGLEAKTTMVTIKAMSDAYFRILEKYPEVKEVFKLGNHLVWIAPSGTALVIDPGAGKEKLTDAEIDKLFVVKK
jgi:Ca-activated chloride channel family protein